MRISGRSIGTWSVVLSLLLLPACATQEKAVRGGGKKLLPAGERKISAMQEKVALLLGKKQYRQALETMASRGDYNQPPHGMEKEFVTAINGLLEAAEEALTRNDFLCAGQSYRCVLAAYPEGRALQSKIRSRVRQVRIHLETCAVKLMDQGLQEYRQGKLDRAISTWQGILTFDDGNGEARKAIETATIQKKTLQAL